MYFTVVKQTTYQLIPFIAFVSGAINVEELYLPDWFLPHQPCAK
jgi:hypothetical protein